MIIKYTLKIAFIVATKNESNKNMQEFYGDNQKILLNNVK